LILAKLNQVLYLFNNTRIYSTKSKGVLKLLKVVMRCYLEVETDSVLAVKHKGLDSDED